MTARIKPYQFFPRPFGIGPFVNPQTAAGTFTTGPLPVEGWGSAQLVLDVTAITGTGTTLDCKMQGLDPVSGKWRDITGAAFTQATTAGGAVTQDLAIDPVRYGKIRASWTVGGATPSVTFTLGALFRSLTS